jgi:hypothetical protein
VLKIHHRHPEAYHGFFEKAVGALGGGEEAEEIEAQALITGAGFFQEGFAGAAVDSEGGMIKTLYQSETFSIHGPRFAHAHEYRKVRSLLSY